MAVSGHRNESSIKRYSKTDETAKNKMASCLMSVVATNNDDLPDNLTGALPAVTTATADKLDLDILTNSQEERIMRDFNFQSSTQSTKQFNFHNYKVDIHS
jgi:hypothetical protein